MEYEEKRIGLNPIPSDLLEYLNEAQLYTYHRMTTLGWRIKFIRRPMHQSPVCCMTDSNEITLALIEGNGFLNTQPDIPLRSDEKSRKS